MKHYEAFLPSSGRKRKCAYDPTQLLLHHLASTPDQDETPPRPWAPAETWRDPEVTTTAHRTGDSEGCPLQSVSQMINKRLKLLMRKSCSLKWSQMRWATCLRQRCLLLDRLKYSAVDSQILTRLKGEDRNSAKQSELFHRLMNYSVF